MSDKNKQAYFRIIKDFDSSKESVTITQFKSQKLILIILGFSFLIFILALLLFFFTPIKRMAPGFPDTQSKLEIIKTQYKIDSIAKHAVLQERYVDNIKNILKGENTALIQANSSVVDSLNPNVIAPSKRENMFRKDIENRDKYNTFQEKPVYSKYSFYKPIEGLITDKFNPRIKHYGVDIVSTQNEPIKSIQGGTVVFAGWTSEDGYVITIQHPNNFLSIYKHNSSLLKGLGDNVLSGEVIALIGNTGELSQGEHLHIEIWQNGYPVDPEKLINF